MAGVNLSGSIDIYKSGHWNKDTGHIMESQVALVYRMPLKWGHLSNQDTCPNGVHNREISLYNTNNYIPCYSIPYILQWPLTDRQ